MSYYDRTMRELTCKGCGERQPMLTRLIFNPHAYVVVVERFALEHERCEKFKNPARARAALRWERLIKALDPPRRSHAGQSRATH